MSKLISLPSILLILVLWGIGAARLVSGIREPIEVDEMMTIKTFASVDYDASSDGMRQVRRFDFKRAAKGIVRCFINNWDTNNHILLSLLVSVSAFFFGFSEFAYRLPSMVATLLLMAVAFCWVKKRTGSLALAFLCGLAISFHPYFAYYGHRSRGYAVGALLVWVQIWLTEIYFQRRPTLNYTVALALLNVVIFLNLVSMLVTWIVPYYLAGAIFLWREPGKNPGDERLRAWLCQGLIALTCIGLFILPNTHHFLASQGKWGKWDSNISSAAVLFNGGKEVFSYYYPLAWGVLAFAGLAGLLLTFKNRATSWLGLVAAMSMLVATVYILGTKTFPYPRVYGFSLVLMIMGVALLWNVKRFRIPLLAILITVLGVQAVKAVRISEGYGYFQLVLAGEIHSQIEARHETKESVFIPLPWDIGEEMRYYLPDGPEWTVMSAAKKSPLSVYFALGNGRFLVNKSGQFRVDYTQWRLQEKDGYWDLPKSNPAARSHSESSVQRVTMKIVRDFSDLGAGELPWMVVWNNHNGYFNITSYAADKIKKHEAPWVIPVNIIHYLAPKSLHFFISNASDLESAKGIIADLKKQDDGELFILVPESP